ncbi:MATE family efflux transporter [Jannaschia aquimarina]|uniref:MepA_1 protein n=1 Tax=Jannaschia aquimarina TaxID=935700 RepID=A0A0D1D4X8_9RHOB|nr:MATE family efflux transporter [Jannaschia aquimarina]KIT15113.1 Multidrug export protein MepA [Jannaschia aquimarina]SNS64421.1 putative efflux protein, MATE family [Jannaschia aquimarina]
MASTSRDLNEGPVWKALLSVSGPMAFGIAAVISVGLVDAYFLGRIGSDALAAVGFVYPITMTIASLSIGMSAGANAAISQALGRKDDEDDVIRVGLHALGIGTVLGALAGLIFFLIDRPLLSLMGATDGVLEAALQYTPVWSASFPALVAMMLMNSVFRAHGNGGRAAGIMIFSASVNIALTPTLILGWGPFPELGVAGAAWSTLIAYVVACAAAAALAMKSGLLRPCGALLQDLWQSAKTLAGVGGPAALSNAIRPAGMAAVTAAVAVLGSSYVAGFGAAGRVQGLVAVPLLALSAGIGPVVGQAWGADRPDRASQALRLSCLFALGYGLVLATALFFLADPIAGLFSDDDQAVSAAALYLRIVGWSLFGFGILVVGNAALNAMSRAGYAMSLSVARVLLVYLPLAWLAAYTVGYWGILGAAVVANVFASVAVMVAARAAGLRVVDIAPIRSLASRLPRNRVDAEPA